MSPSPRGLATSALVAVSVSIAVAIMLIYYFIQPTLDMMLFSALGVAASTMGRTRSTGLFTGFGFRVGLWGAACVANQIISDPKESALGLGMVLVGLPIYYIWLRRSVT